MPPPKEGGGRTRKSGEALSKALTRERPKTVTLTDAGPLIAVIDAGCEHLGILCKPTDSSSQISRPLRSNVVVA